MLDVKKIVIGLHLGHKHGLVKKDDIWCETMVPANKTYEISEQCYFETCCQLSLEVVDELSAVRCKSHVVYYDDEDKKMLSAGKK